MLDQAARFTGSIPDHYDRGLGPDLFVDYAADLARRAATCKPERVLETAAGTGIVTRLLRDALPPSARFVASDLNLPMLEIARHKFVGTGQVEFRQADATALPFADATFDAVVCQFGLMFFPDKAKAYSEAFRVLAPNGHYHFNVWDSFDFNSFARIAHEAVGQFFEHDAPAFFTVPFGYHRIDEIKTALVQVGFDEISMEVVRINKRIEDVRRLAEGLIFGSPIVAEIEARGTADPAAIAGAVTTAFRIEFGENARHMTLQAIVIDAHKPFDQLDG